MEWTISAVVAIAGLFINFVTIIAGIAAYITMIKGRLDSHDYDIEDLLKHTKDDAKHHNSEAYEEFKNNINIQFSNLNTKITEQSVQLNSKISEQSAMLGDLRNQVQRLFNANNR